MVHVQFKIDNINMKKYKLGDFLDNYGDGIHGTPKYDINGDYYFINGSNLGNGKIVINDDIQKVSAEEYTKIRRPIVNGKTILVSINGTLGKLAIYHGEKIGLGKSACFLNLKEAIYVPFIFAILMTKEFKTYLHNIAGQSTIKNVSPNQIANYEFYAPSSLCDCIAYSQTILKINEKIELNRQINDNLEAMAKQLYDYWFVQFDFPNEEGKPYKSSGGAMVWNEKLKREIPEGWNVANVFDELSVQYGFPFSTELFTEEPTSIPVVRIRDILENSVSAYSEEEVDEKYKLQKQDLLVGMDGNFHMNYWNDNVSYLNQRSVRLRAKSKSTVSIMQAKYDIAPYIKAKELRAKGSTVGHLSDKDLKELFVLVCPNIDFRNKFDSILAEIIENRCEMIELTKQRNELLPLLMNGQATVNYHLSDD